MKQVWLDSNRRIWIIAALVPTLLLVAGVWLCIAGARASGKVDPDATPAVRGWMLGLGAAMAAVGALGAAAAAWMASRPRVAFARGEVLFYVRLGAPARIPIGDVECFLMGQGPALLPGERHRKTETVTVVVRLRERAEEWSHGDAHPLLAAWCDGHITLRGTWCEPLNLDVISRMNRALHAASHAAKSVS
jgi:hypothetical protein